MDNNQVPNTQGEAIEEVAEEVKETVADKVEDVKEAVEEKVEDVKEAVTDKFQEIKEDLKDVAAEPIIEAQSADGQTQPVAKAWTILSIISFVCGICALAFCWSGWSALSFAIPAIVLAAIVKNKNGETKKSKLGMTFGIIGAIVGAVFGIAISACTACASAAIDNYEYYYTVIAHNFFK